MAKRTKRKTRTPAEIAKGAILKMPIGQLNQLATELVEADQATAEYLADKLGTAIADAIAERDAPPDQHPAQ